MRGGKSESRWPVARLICDTARSNASSVAGEVFCHPTHFPNVLTGGGFDLLGGGRRIEPRKVVMFRHIAEIV